MGTSSSTSAYVYTDYLPGSQTSLDSNGQVYGTTVTSFYSGNGMTSWNREHVWPDSRGGSQVEADIHMPRPTIPAENGSRGNSFYVEGKKSSSAGWDPAMESFGDSTYRGDSARIIFYCVVASSNLSLIDAESDNANNKTMGKLSDLLKWNIENPVTQRELNRNEGAEYLQGNRNPFIDHPEYACKIWGDTNDATRKICQNDPSGSTTKTLTGISVTLDDGSSTNTGVYVDVDSYVQLKVTANYDDGTTADVTNSSSYSTTANNTNYGSYYSVSNGKITGLAETSYAAITVSYSTISTVRNIYVTAKGTGNGTPIGSGTDDPVGD
jgi:endonuclease I